MPAVGEHIAVEDWPIDVDSDLKEGSVLVKVRSKASRLARILVN